MTADCADLRGLQKREFSRDRFGKSMRFANPRKSAKSAVPLSRRRLSRDVQLAAVAGTQASQPVGGLGREAVTFSCAHSPNGVHAPSTQQPAAQAGKPVFLSRACREPHRSGGVTVK